MGNDPYINTYIIMPKAMSGKKIKYLPKKKKTKKKGYGK